MSFTVGKKAVTLTLLLAVVVFGGIFRIQPAHASSYNCTSGRFVYTHGPHCYGIARWDGNIDGSYATITVANLTSPYVSSNTLGFIDQQMWLTQLNGDHWAEVGYTTWAEGPVNEEDYFWGGSPDGINIDNYGLDNVHSTDIGGWMYITLKNFPSQGYVQEFIHTPRDLLPEEHYYAHMYQPNEYSFGSELYGNINGSSGSAVYRNNEFYLYSNNLWGYQQAQPTDLIGNPNGHDGWENPERMSEDIVPHTSTNGGQFTAWCGC